MSSGAIAAVATFDSLSEGTAGTTLTDGGITFFDLDQRLADAIPSFSIEALRQNYLIPLFLHQTTYPLVALQRVKSLALGDLAPPASPLAPPERQQV
ncbi:MAG: hypothetical protein HC840_23760 [Leptolyngbyaceae cyanobacterium RM2_2_4]|nr:hypothetical protein [Leptolyngbyaceae cyanobacterium RM2_2_4]